MTYGIHTGSNLLTLYNDPNEFVGEKPNPSVLLDVAQTNR